MKTAIKKTATKMKAGGAKKTTTAKKMQTGGMASSMASLDGGKKKKKSTKGMENVYGKNFKRKSCASWTKG